MSGETIVVEGIPVVLEANAAGNIASGSLGQATNMYDRSLSDNYPDAEFVAKINFATAPASGTISLMAQPLDVDGTNDTPSLTATFMPLFIGNLQFKYSTTGDQYLTCRGRDLPAKAYYYLYNNGTAQPISVGWTLKVTPRSYKAKV